MANLVKPGTIQVPYFELWMGGQRLSPLLHSLVQSVSVTDSASEASTATIQIADPDFVLLDDPQLVRSTPFRIYGGWLNDNRLWLQGYISSVDVNFSAGGSPIVEILVMDESYTMDTLPKYNLYEYLRSDQIAEKIAQQYGLKFVGDQGPRTYKRKVQSKETDIKFLRAMADSEWFLVKVLNGTLYWKARNFAGDPVKTVWYRRPPFDVISFNPKLVQADRLDGTVDSSIDPSTGEVQTSAVDSFTAGSSDLGTSAADLGGDTGNDGNSWYVAYDPSTGQTYNVDENGNNLDKPSRATGPQAG